MNGEVFDHEACFLCRHCIPEWRQLISAKKKTLSVKKGKHIFREGDPVEGIFFMYEGSAKVSKNWGGQKELILRFARPGDVLGLRGFGGDAVYPISAITIEDSTLCFVDNNFFETILQTNHAITYQLLKIYAAELQKAEKKMRDLVHRDVRGRIAQALLEIQQCFGVNNDGFIAVPVTRQDIASFAGTTYETIFKFFNQLLDLKILSTSGKSIRINESSRLESFISEQKE